VPCAFASSSIQAPEPGWQLPGFSLENRLQSFLWKPLPPGPHGRWGAAAPDNLRRKPNLADDQRREAIRRRDRDGETLRLIGRSYNVSHSTISRLTA
jgi:hypothetical protein